MNIRGPVPEHVFRDYEMYADDPRFLALRERALAKMLSYSWVKNMIRGEDYEETLEGIMAWATKYYGSWERYHRERYTGAGMHGPRYPATYLLLKSTVLEPWSNDYRLHMPFQTTRNSVWHTPLLRETSNLVRSIVQGEVVPEPAPEPPPTVPTPPPEPPPTVPTPPDSEAVATVKGLLAQSEMMTVRLRELLQGLGG